MGRYLVLWRVNFDRWPMDPSKSLELNETLWTVMDDLMKKGLVKDYGIFPEAESGFLIGEGEVNDIFKSVNMFIPYVSCEVHEVVPYKKQKEIVRELFKVQMAAMKK